MEYRLRAGVTEKPPTSTLLEKIMENDTRAKNY